MGLSVSVLDEGIAAQYRHAGTRVDLGGDVDVLGVAHRYELPPRAASPQLGSYIRRGRVPRGRSDHRLGGWIEQAGLHERCQHAPAPHKSSTAGRNDESGHLSPAAMTAITLWGWSSTTHCAIAAALRSDAPTHVSTRAASAWAIVEPFGDGNTSRLGGGAAARTVAGHKLTSPGVATERPTARTASWCSARWVARSSRHRLGTTSIPASIATVRVVVNDRTSTTTAMSAPATTASIADRPHSKRNAQSF